MRFDFDRLTLALACVAALVRCSRHPRDGESHRAPAPVPLPAPLPPTDPDPAPDPARQRTSWGIPDLGLADCEPGPWRTRRLLQADGVTVDLETRSNCGFPDATSDIRYVGVDPTGTRTLLLEVSLETSDFERELPTLPQEREIAVPWARCRIKSGVPSCHHDPP